MREQIDVGVAVGGEHSDPAMLCDEAVPDGESFFFFRDVAECVRRRGVEQLRDVWSQ